MKTMEYNITTADGETHKGGITIKRGHSFTSVKIINNIKEIVGQEFIEVFDVDNECEIKRCYGKVNMTKNFMVMVKEDDGKLRAGMFLIEDGFRRVIHIKRLTDKYAIFNQWRRPYCNETDETGYGLICEYWGRKRLIREKGGFQYIDTGGIQYYNINYLIKEGKLTEGDDRQLYNKLVSNIETKKIPWVIHTTDNVDRVEDNHMFEA